MIRYVARSARRRLALSACALACACAGHDTPARRTDTAIAEPAPVAARAAAPAPVDTVIPAGPFGDAVRRGHALLAATRDSLPSHVGNSLRCLSCHLDDGRRARALPLTRAYANYPQYRARRASVELIEGRINDCFVRSLNGRPLNTDGADMRDIISYLSWLGRGVAAQPPDTQLAQESIAILDAHADTARGAAVFTASCARCHGASGEGTAVAPPLWGPMSFNIGAGMARYRTSALFVLHNMPFDRPNTLTLQQALDVARYIGSRPRPDLAGKENDWPHGDAPDDLPYSTRAGRAGASTARARAHNGAR